MGPCAFDSSILNNKHIELDEFGTVSDVRQLVASVGAISKEDTMALDQYVTLGRSGLRVSPFCLGAMTFGEDLGWGSSVEESQQIIDRYIDLGGNFIDTANFYTKSHSEKIIGDHVGRHAARRDRLVIATKFSGNLYPGDPNGGGSGRKSIVAQLDNSLRRLQTDYVDLYWLHNWDVHTPIEETMSALADLVRSGKVRYIGVSDTPAWKIAEANVTAHFRGWPAFIGLQVEYSLLERSIEQELSPMAKELGLGMTPWSPLKSGVLSGKSVARTALAWVQAQPGVTSTIIGARRMSQLDDNVGALSVKLTAADLAKLDALTKPTFGFPQNMQPMFPAIHNGGTTVNGVSAPLSPFVIDKGDKPY
jgi:aryl-alcohol dehydrogenase-like predicted oxidoreductase